METPSQAEHCLQLIEMFKKQDTNLKAPDTVRGSGSFALNDHSSKELHDEDWEILLAGSKKLTFKPDEVIIKEGEVFRKIYYINKGTCSVYKEDLLLTNLHEHDTFGAISFFQGSGATATVKAKEAVEVVIIDGKFIDDLATTNSTVVAGFYKYLCKELADRLRKIS